MNCNGGEPILKEMKKIGSLKSRTENKMIQILADFIFDQYSMYPSEEDAILVCKAALKMFGNVKGGIVRLFNQHSAFQSAVPYY